MSITETLFGATATSTGSAKAKNKKLPTFEPVKKTDLELFAVAPQVRKESRREKKHRLESEAIAAPNNAKAKNILDNVMLVPDPRDRGEQGAGNKKKRLRHNVDRNEEEELRTVFVGNLPNDATPKPVKHAFEDCGKIVSVRIRNRVLEEEKDKKRGRAVQVMRGEIKKGEQFSATAYIVFAQSESVEKAVAKTGLVLNGRHIFVTKVDDDSKAFPPQTSIFCGNLPYDVTEEEIWTYFTQHEIADVKRVRIVKDKYTGLGKGFAYVEFMNAATVERAISTRGNPLREREIRICHVTKDKNVGSNTASRRELRKAQSSAATPAGPLKRGSKVETRVMSTFHKGGADMPSWMGMTTNPRKKLSRDLRPLITPSGNKPKRPPGPPRRGGAPPAAKKAPAPAAKKS